MLSFTLEEIHSHLAEILQTKRFEITPIGNHELGRHLVYKVLQPVKAPLVFKLYFKHNRRLRELASLNQLAGTSVKCARIGGAGTLPDGTEWLLSTFIPGQILDQIWDRMNLQEEQQMFEDLGDELGKIHAAAIFDFFGHWDEQGRSLHGIQRYYTEFVRSSEYVFRHLQCQDLPEKVLLNRAISIIRRHYHLMTDITESRLTHHDYDGRNILVDRTGQGWTIKGIIDFEQSYPGNSEVDLAGIYARYLMGTTHRDESFFRGYQKHLPVDPLFFCRLPYYLLCKGVVICSWTYQQAPDYYQEGLRLVERFHTLVEDEICLY